MNLLRKKQMVKGFPVIHEPSNSCKSCILGKQHKEIFPTSASYRARSPLEMVHTEL